MLHRHYVQFLTFAPNYVNLSLQPLAVVVCPGWKKAQFIFELLEDYSMSSKPLHPVLLTIGLHKDEAKNMKLPKGCKHPSQAVWFSLRNAVEPCQAGAAAQDTGTSPVTGGTSPRVPGGRRWAKVPSWLTAVALRRQHDSFTHQLLIKYLC